MSYTSITGMRSNRYPLMGSGDGLGCGCGCGGCGAVGQVSGSKPSLSDLSLLGIAATALVCSGLAYYTLPAAPKPNRRRRRRRSSRRRG